MSDSPLMKVAAERCRDELTDSTCYRRLSELGVERNHEFKHSLSELAIVEQKHYDFWMKYIPERRITANRAKLYLTLLFRVVLGTTFAVRYLERHEIKTIKTYKSISHLVPVEDKTEFEEMVEEEESHEKSLESRIEELPSDTSPS